MALTQIDFDEEEESKLYDLSHKWEINKPKTVRKIIREYIEGDNNVST